MGGNHAPIWQNCGFYGATILSENAVHSLEHGAVWITYQPQLPADQVAALRQLAKRQSHLLVSQFVDLPTPVVVSAWGRQLRLDSVDDPRLEQFVRRSGAEHKHPSQGARAAAGGGTPSDDVLVQDRSCGR